MIKKFLIVFLFILLNLPTIQAAEEKKSLVIKDNYVEGVVLQFEDAAESFGEEEAFDIPIKPFNREDYEVSDPEGLEQAMQTVDAFGYPRQSNYYLEHAKELEAKVEVVDTQSKNKIVQEEQE